MPLSGTYIVAKIGPGDAKSFADDLKKQIDKINDDSDTTCGAPLFGGLSVLLSDPNFKSGSIAIVFTRSTANDSAANNATFLKNLTTKRAQVQFHFFLCRNIRMKLSNVARRTFFFVHYNVIATIEISGLSFFLDLLYGNR